MPAVLSVSILALLAGIAMPFGAWLAKVDGVKQYRFSRELHHSVLAFGAGVLLAAVAFVLVPHGIAELNPLFSVLCFICGGLAFMGLDHIIAKMAGSCESVDCNVNGFYTRGGRVRSNFYRASR